LFPTLHVYVYSAHAMFTGAPLPQHSLLRSKTWWDKYMWRATISNTINDIHDHPETEQSGCKITPNDHVCYLC